jgi:hypothetical protein
MSYASLSVKSVLIYVVSCPPKGHLSSFPLLPTLQSGLVRHLINAPFGIRMLCKEPAYKREPQLYIPTTPCDRPQTLFLAPCPPSTWSWLALVEAPMKQIYLRASELFQRLAASCRHPRTWYAHHLYFFYCSYLLKPCEAAWEDGLLALEAGKIPSPDSAKFSVKRAFYRIRSGCSGQPSKPRSTPVHLARWFRV